MNIKALVRKIREKWQLIRREACIIVKRILYRLRLR